MNLQAKHFPLILLGGLVGGAVGWLLSFLPKPGSIPQLEMRVSLEEAGLIFGGLAGMALVVIALVVRGARDPAAGPARNFNQINGIGSAFIGKSDRRDDRSYVTTEWFTFLWIPLFPVCRYRVIKHEEVSDLFYQQYTILEKLPPRAIDAIKVYGLMLFVLLAIICVALWQVDNIGLSV